MAYGRILGHGKCENIPNNTFRCNILWQINKTYIFVCRTDLSAPVSDLARTQRNSRSFPFWCDVFAVFVWLMLSRHPLCQNWIVIIFKASLPLLSPKGDTTRTWQFKFQIFCQWFLKFYNDLIHECLLFLIFVSSFCILRFLSVRVEKIFSIIIIRAVLVFRCKTFQIDEESETKVYRHFSDTYRRTTINTNIPSKPFECSRSPIFEATQ